MALSDQEQTDLSLRVESTAKAVAELKAVILEGRTDIFEKSPIRKIQEIWERIRGANVDRKQDPVDILQDTLYTVQILARDMADIKARLGQEH